MRLLIKRGFYLQRTLIVKCYSIFIWWFLVTSLHWIIAENNGRCIHVHEQLKTFINDQISVRIAVACINNEELPRTCSRHRHSRRNRNINNSIKNISVNTRTSCTEYFEYSGEIGAYEICAIKVTLLHRFHEMLHAVISNQISGNTIRREWGKWKLPVPRCNKTNNFGRI